MLNLARSAGLARAGHVARQAGQRRHGGHWLHKNVRNEENAGLREASYKYWQFDPTSMSRIGAYLILPGIIFWVLAVDEAKAKDAQIGKKQEYGIMPPTFEAKK